MTQQEPGRNRKPDGADKSAAADLTRNLPRLFVEFQQLDATMAKKYAEPAWDWRSRKVSRPRAAASVLRARRTPAVFLCGFAANLHAVNSRYRQEERYDRGE